MPTTLSLPDLHALVLAALKALILEQQDHYKVGLSSRATEIERLKSLVDKLRRMMFGAKSEKVLRQY
jgi:transposase